MSTFYSEDFACPKDKSYFRNKKLLNKNKLFINEDFKFFWIFTCPNKYQLDDIKISHKLIIFKTLSCLIQERVAFHKNWHYVSLELTKCGMYGLQSPALTSTSKIHCNRANISKGSRLVTFYWALDQLNKLNCLF